MNAEEVKTFIEKRGYTNVTVKAYTNSCRLHYETAVTSETMNIQSKITDLPLSWLNKHFKPLLTAYTLTLADEKTGEASK